MYENTNEIDDKLEVENGKNIWKVDGPIGRFRFFVIQFGILLTALVIIFFKNFIIPSVPLCPVGGLQILFIIVLLMLWVDYVAIAKRFYDITGSASKGIILSVIVFLFTCFSRTVVGIVVLILFFIPGKMIKSNY